MEKPKISEPRTAWHDMECDYCGRTIWKGEDFRFWGDGGKICAECGEELANE